MTMHTTTAPVAPPRTPSARRTPRSGLLGTGSAATALATAAVMAVAAIADAIEVPLAVGGDPIPLAGFAVMTALWSFVGVAMAAGMARRARRPRALFVRTTVVLTALSCIPSLAADADTATGITLCLTHLVAAAVVIPALARRLGDGRTR